jgi:hypothetical protein
LQTIQALVLRLCRRTVRKGSAFPAVALFCFRGYASDIGGRASKTFGRSYRKGKAFPHCAAAKPRGSNTPIWFCIVALVLCAPFCLQAHVVQTPAQKDDSEVRPPITEADLRIVKQARKILSSESKWNRFDNRKCPAQAKTFSLYCAFEQASIDVNGKFDHRGAALQEARFVIDEITINRNYDHRLMDYNNDQSTTFADIQEVFQIVESIIILRLKPGAGKH